MKQSAAIQLVMVLVMALSVQSNSRELTDARGNTHSVPKDLKHVICSGPGCLRLLTYLQAQDLAVGVDDIERKHRVFDARPYALAHPQLKTRPLFGAFRGYDNPELILSLNPQPQVIFKTHESSMGYDPVELEQKTGIPVIVIDYGDLGQRKPELYQSLRLMAKALDRQNRAEQVIDYMESLMADLKQRTSDIPSSQHPPVYLGGVAFKGPHGIQSTEPAYPPLNFLNTPNVAHDTHRTGKEIRHAQVAKEMLLVWDPAIILLDLATLQLGDGAGALHELRSDPAYRSLRAVKQAKVYGVLPYNLYSTNYGSVFANAYFIGKLLYPDRFSDVDPTKKADEIYRFFVGQPVFQSMNELFDRLVFKPLAVRPNAL